MREQTRTVYVASDGKIFESSYECSKYEKSILKTLVSSWFDESIDRTDSEITNFIVAKFDKIKHIIEG